MALLLETPNFSDLHPKVNEEGLFLEILTQDTMMLTLVCIFGYKGRGFSILAYFSPFPFKSGYQNSNKHLRLDDNGKALLETDNVPPQLPPQKSFIFKSVFELS